MRVMFKRVRVMKLIVRVMNQEKRLYFRNWIQKKH